MAELNDKLITYGNLSTFYDKLQEQGLGGNAIEEITYSELKALRDNKQLVPGQQYRITDYVTTTAQENTQSAGHQFDIIVVADSEDKLNENARAINHPDSISAMIVSYNSENMIYVRYPEGDDENGYAWAYNYDTKGYATLEEEIKQGINWNNINTSDIIYTDTLTPSIGDVLDMSGDKVEVMDYINLDYFANSKLDAWELKYCLDNDTNRFSWAQQTEKIDKIQVTSDDLSGTYLCLRYPNNDRDGKYAWAIVNNSDDKDINNTSVDWTHIMTQADTNFYTDSENPSINNTGYRWDGAVFYADNDFVSERNIVPAGKGVIYYMKDEWNNECPYDFKNIQFKRYAITNVSTTGYTQDETSALSETFLFGNNGNKCFATKDVHGNWVPANESHQSGSDSQNTSIEWEIDENTFAWYYTFNGEKKESADGEIELYDITSQKLILSPECIQWLESQGSGSDISDKCYNNSIKPRTLEYFGDDAYYKGRIVLNDIVFLNGVSYCYYNNEYKYWEFSTAYCHGNVFGVECRNNTIGNYFGSNTIGNNVYNNTIGNGFRYNTIGNRFGSNTIGNEFYQNTIGNNVYRNTIGNEFYQNTIGNEFYYNTIGNNVYNNTIGNDAYYNTIVSDVYNNTIGNNFYYNTIGNNVYYNTIGNYFQNNSIGNSFGSNTIGNEFYQNTIGNNFQYNRLGEGVQYLDFTTNYGSVTLQYLYVLSGYKYNAKTSVPTGITANATYSQTIGFNTAGSFVVKNMLD